MNNIGGKLGSAALQKRLDRESFDALMNSEAESLQLSGAENDIISGIRLRNKIMRDQGNTDNEGAFSVYESSTDNDLMAFIGLNKGKKITDDKRISNRNLQQFVMMISESIDKKDITQQSPQTSPIKVTRNIDEISVSDDGDIIMRTEPKEVDLNLDEDFAAIEN